MTDLYRKPKEELEERNSVATVKNGAAGVIIWGCVSAAGVGKKLTNSQNYDRSDFPVLPR